MRAALDPVNIALCCCDPGLQDRIAALLSGPFRISSFARTTATVTDLEQFHCGVAVIGWPTGDDLPWLRPGCDSPGLPLPTLLVTTRRDHADARLDGIPMDDRVPVGDIDAALRPAVRRQAIRRGFAELLLESSIPEALRAVLKVTCQHCPPPLFLKTACRLAGVNRVTAWKGYHKYFGGKARVRLEDLHESIALARCLGWKTPENRWKDVAVLARCSTDWLHDAVVRHIQFLPSELDDREIEAFQLRGVPELLRQRSCRMSDWAQHPRRRVLRRSLRPDGSSWRGTCSRFAGNILPSL